MTEKLKPCPFCGGEAEAHEVTFPYHYWDVWCDGECFGHFCEKPTEAEAIAAWNTRTATGDDFSRTVHNCSTCQYRYVVGQRPYASFGYMCGFGDGKKLCVDDTGILDHMGCEHWEKELR